MIYGVRSGFKLSRAGANGGTEPPDTAVPTQPDLDAILREDPGLFHCVEIFIEEILVA